MEKTVIAFGANTHISEKAWPSVDIDRKIPLEILKKRIKKVMKKHNLGPCIIRTTRGGYNLWFLWDERTLSEIKKIHNELMGDPNHRKMDCRIIRTGGKWENEKSTILIFDGVRKPTRFEEVVAGGRFELLTLLTDVMEEVLDHPFYKRRLM